MSAIEGINQVNAALSRCGPGPFSFFPTGFLVDPLSRVIAPLRLYADDQKGDPTVNRTAGDVLAERFTGLFRSCDRQYAHTVVSRWSGSYWCYAENVLGESQVFLAKKSFEKRST